MRAQLGVKAEMARTAREIEEDRDRLVDLMDRWTSRGIRSSKLAVAATRVVIAVGEESLTTFTGRTSVAAAELLGQRATVFPSHHGGFLGGEFGYAGQPEAFARKLREVLDDQRSAR